MPFCTSKLNTSPVICLLLKNPQTGSASVLPRLVSSSAISKNSPPSVGFQFSPPSGSRLTPNLSKCAVLYAVATPPMLLEIPHVLPSGSRKNSGADYALQRAGVAL